MKKNFSNRLLQLLIIHYSLLILTSCSVQKQISKSAKRLVIKDSSLLTAHVGISIYEPEKNKYWYNYQGDKYFVPASNTKLPTCYAAMKYLGDSLVGVRYEMLNDTITEIYGTGDPTFLHPDFKTHPVLSFLKKQHELIFTNSSNIEPLGNGWTWNDYMEDYMAPRSELPIYGNVVRVKWINKDSLEVIPHYFYRKSDEFSSGFEVFRSFEQNDFSFINGKYKNRIVPFEPYRSILTKLLEDTLANSNIYINLESRKREKGKIIHSQPTDSLLKITMHRSDNFFAEQTLLMVSNEKLGYMSDEKIIDTLLKTDLKDLPQKPRWVDGSGLSRYDLFTPQDFVSILNKIKNEFGMERIKVILPTGNTGTLSNYYKAENGYLFAKTGTLGGVVSLSGYLYTKKNKLLIFSVLVNNHQSSATAVRRAVEKFIEGLRVKY